MLGNERAELNAIAGECQTYEPIAATVNLIQDEEEETLEDAGCDSCLHWQRGRCEVFKGNFKI